MIFKKCTFLFWGEKYGMKLLKCNLSERHIFAAWWYRKEQQEWLAVEASEQRVALFPAEFLNIILCIFLQMTQSPCVSCLIPPNYHFYACIPAGIMVLELIWTHKMSLPCFVHWKRDGRKMHKVTQMSHPTSCALTQACTFLKFWLVYLIYINRRDLLPMNTS